jgi:hypothetical protein
VNIGRDPLNGKPSVFGSLVCLLERPSVREVVHSQGLSHCGGGSDGSGGDGGDDGLIYDSDAMGSRRTHG